MTELTSQFYDATLRTAHAAGAASGIVASTADAPPRLKFGPPWVRAIIVDVHTLEPLPPGRPGLLRVLDLANRGSVAAILTEDFAIAEDVAIGPAIAADTASHAPTASRPRALPFRLLGRAQGSEPRGCSLDAEGAIAATAGAAS